MVGGCRGYVVAGLTENKTKPSSLGLAELGNKDPKKGVKCTNLNGEWAL